MLEYKQLYNICYTYRITLLCILCMKINTWVMHICILFHQCVTNKRHGKTRFYFDIDILRGLDGWPIFFFPHITFFIFSPLCKRDQMFSCHTGRCALTYCLDVVIETKTSILEYILPIDGAAERAYFSGRFKREKRLKKIFF